MYEDNTGCIAIATNSMTTGKTKHIDIKLHFLRDLVKDGSISIVWCATDSMLADALSKFSLLTSLHLKLCNKMMHGTYAGPRE